MHFANTKSVDIYTDGACAGNPGPGGFGAVLLYKSARKEISGGYALTTNNRMELIAVIKALETLKEPCRINLYSDSRYVVDAVEKGWAQRWQKNNWKRNKNDKALNHDLWEHLLSLTAKHRINFIWVKGHADNPENNRCDQLAREAIENADLLVDEGFKPEQ